MKSTLAPLPRKQVTTGENGTFRVFAYPSTINPLAIALEDSKGQLHQIWQTKHPQSHEMTVAILTRAFIKPKGVNPRFTIHDMVPEGTNAARKGYASGSAALLDGCNFLPEDLRRAKACVSNALKYERILLKEASHARKSDAHWHGHASPLPATSAASRHSPSLALPSKGHTDMASGAAIAARAEPAPVAALREKWEYAPGNLTPFETQKPYKTTGIFAEGTKQDKVFCVTCLDYKGETHQILVYNSKGPDYSTNLAMASEGFKPTTIIDINNPTLHPFLRKLVDKKRVSIKRNQKEALRDLKKNLDRITTTNHLDERPIQQQTYKLAPPHGEMILYKIKGDETCYVYEHRKHSARRDGIIRNFYVVGKYEYDEENRRYNKTELDTNSQHILSQVIDPLEGREHINILALGNRAGIYRDARKIARKSPHSEPLLRELKKSVTPLLAEIVPKPQTVKFGSGQTLEIYYDDNHPESSIFIYNDGKSRHVYAAGKDPTDSLSDRQIFYREHLMHENDVLHDLNDEGEMRFLIDIYAVIPDKQNAASTPNKPNPISKNKLVSDLTMVINYCGREKLPYLLEPVSSKEFTLRNKETLQHQKYRNKATGQEFCIFVHMPKSGPPTLYYVNSTSHMHRNAWDDSSPDKDLIHSLMANSAANRPEALSSTINDTKYSDISDPKSNCLNLTSLLKLTEKIPETQKEMALKLIREEAAKSKTKIPAKKILREIQSR